MEGFFVIIGFVFAWKLLIVDPDEKTQEAGVNSKQSFMLISKKKFQNTGKSAKKLIIIRIKKLHKYMRMRGYDNKCTAGDNRPNEMGELNRRALRLLAGSFSGQLCNHYNMAHL